MTVSEKSLAYWRQSARPGAAEQVLRSTLLELLRHVGAEQLRALCFAAGVRLATETPLGKVEKLSELEAAACRFLAERGRAPGVGGPGARLPAAARLVRRGEPRLVAGTAGRLLHRVAAPARRG